LQRDLIGHNAEAAGMFSHGVNHRVDVHRQAGTQLADHANFLAGAVRFAFVSHRYDLIQRDAKHHVGIFELAGVRKKQKSFIDRQDGAPVLLNRVIPAGLGAGSHCALS
jgi:hypothetical protein